MLKHVGLTREDRLIFMAKTTAATEGRLLKADRNDYNVMFQRVAGTITDARMGMTRITPAELITVELLMGKP